MTLAFLKPAAKQYAAYSSGRKKLSGLSGEALSLSKRAIFSVHRGQTADAKQQIDGAEKRLIAAEKLIKKIPALANEGVFRAALEENTEAILFYRYVTKGKIGSLPARNKPPKVLIGGAADFTGELVRYAVKQATLGNTGAINDAQKMTEAVVDFLLRLDLTGDLRQKFDQAKRNLRRMEEISYDLSLRTFRK